MNNNNTTKNIEALYERLKILALFKQKLLFVNEVGNPKLKLTITAIPGNVNQSKNHYGKM